MKYKEAKDILISHNEWRRDNDVPAKTEMTCPTKLGLAIEKAIEALSELERYCVCKKDVDIYLDAETSSFKCSECDKSFKN